VFVDPLNAHRAEDSGAKIGTSSISKSSNSRADIVIGLVNIMPPAAMRTVENLFRLLLNACASPGKVRLRLFSLGNGPSQPAEISGAGQDYERLDELWESPDSEHPLDALIVTGTESRARAMQDEPCWPNLQKICDWAAENTISTIWSCFSAHAAVLHMDNIHRQPFTEKLSGIFECEKASNHPIYKNMPAQWPAPHSRYNTLNEAELEAKRYEILSRSAITGADSFIKQHKNSQFLFLQGHLEYGSEMLFSEYCRDLKRFSLGQSAICPKPPQNYFDQTTLHALATASPDVLSSADFIVSVTARLSNDWQAHARRLYTAWLAFISEQKTNAIREAALLNAPFAAFNALHPSETHGHIAQQ
jgi:homoserine O-succinyltransferase/O-acetyltransferase